MLRIYLGRLIPVILALQLLVSCNMPEFGAPPTPIPTSPGQIPSAAHTAAAETIIAQLTQVSIPTTQTTPLSPLTTRSTTTSTPIGTETTGMIDTPTPERSPTVEPSPTPTQVQATFAPGDPRSSLGEPTWQDTFNNGNHWYLYTDENASFEVKDGNLVMISSTTGSRNAWMLTENQPVDYYLEIPFSTEECSGLDRYGLILRSEDAVTGYLYAFSCDGRYSFRSWNGQRANKLVDWTESSDIRAGSNQVNRLGIRVEGDTYSLYANGSLLTKVSDPSYPEGGFGVLIGAESTEDFTVKVDEVAYWELP